AGRRGLGRGGDGFPVFVARLANEDTRIDQPRQSREAAPVDSLATGGHSLVARIGSGGDYAPVLDQYRADLVEASRRIDDPDILDAQRVHRAFSPSRRGSSRASMTAMRTATPISTCASMTLCGPSAMSEAISTPRFIGPGCM